MNKNTANRQGRFDKDILNKFLLSVYSPHSDSTYRVGEQNEVFDKFFEKNLIPAFPYEGKHEKNWREDNYSLWAAAKFTEAVSRDKKSVFANGNFTPSENIENWEHIASDTYDFFMKSPNGGVLVLPKFEIVEEGNTASLNILGGSATYQVDEINIEGVKDGLKLYSPDFTVTVSIDTYSIEYNYKGAVYISSIAHNLGVLPFVRFGGKTMQPFPYVSVLALCKKHVMVSSNVDYELYHSNTHTQRQDEDCETCNGSGLISGDTCNKCKGTGHMKASQMTTYVRRRYAGSAEIANNVDSLRYISPDASFFKAKADILDKSKEDLRNELFIFDNYNESRASGESKAYTRKKYAEHINSIISVYGGTVKFLYSLLVGLNSFSAETNSYTLPDVNVSLTEMTAAAIDESDETLGNARKAGASFFTLSAIEEQLVKNTIGGTMQEVVLKKMQLYNLTNKYVGIETKDVLLMGSAGFLPQEEVTFILSLGNRIESIYARLGAAGFLATDIEVLRKEVANGDV